ncbi:DUF3775 domain-containing protein [Sphingosinicella soli]|uniref:DUF3775 domain-containing protein n=1 Tax=Sphingosinicella soli TaxID=333708 RepID=A0A7W7B5Z9_9SPHN|nr:DUF3775 domain-containing protein [Sphingosinicella soli]MBB4633783.1 hypothetical protein [Sphingosinicella soli]
MELTISLEDVCRIVLRAREYDAQVPAVDPDDSSSMADDRAVGVLEDSSNTVEEELRSMMEDLNEDEQAELYTLMLVGAGDYDAAEWEDALAVVNEEVSDIPEALMRTPMLASLLETGLAAFGLNCDRVGTVG